jgi:hypothetical protein
MLQFDGLTLARYCIDSTDRIGNRAPGSVGVLLQWSRFRLHQQNWSRSEVGVAFIIVYLFWDPFKYHFLGTLPAGCTAVVPD